MKYERAILITFLGNYLINNVVAAIVALMHLSGNPVAQYATYFILAAIAVALFSWWYFRPLAKGRGVVDGIILGVIALVVAVITAFVSGISGVLAQTGSFTQMISVLPNFWPFIWNWSTLALLGYWVIPSAIVGYLAQRKAPAASHVPPPMI
jgi:hypothetical protein